MLYRAGAPKASVFVRPLDGRTWEGCEDGKVQMVVVEASDGVVGGHCANDAVAARARVRVGALAEPAASCRDYGHYDGG